MGPSASALRRWIRSATAGAGGPRSADGVLHAVVYPGAGVSRWTSLPIVVSSADLISTRRSCVTDITPVSQSQTQPSRWSGWSLSLAILAYVIWNWGYRQGTTGSSIGKSVLKFKVVSEATGQPIGFGMSVVRQLAHFVDAIICYIGYLFPLWDAKRQTIADKIMSTVGLPI